MKNKVHTFALRLAMTRPIQALIVAAFFISALHQNSIGCCISSDSRYIALLDVSKSESNSLLYFKNIISSKMTRPTKNASKAKFTSTPTERHTVITFSLSGASKSMYLYLTRVILHSYVDELTKGYISSDLRLIKRIEALNTLLPEGRKELIGKTVKIK